MNTFVFSKGPDAECVCLCRQGSPAAAGKSHPGDNEMNGHGCGPIELYLRRQGEGQAWPRGYRPPNLVLGQCTHHVRHLSRVFLMGCPLRGQIL